MLPPVGSRRMSCSLSSRTWDQVMLVSWRVRIKSPEQNWFIKFLNNN